MMVGNINVIFTGYSRQNNIFWWKNLKYAWVYWSWVIFNIKLNITKLKMMFVYFGIKCQKGGFTWCMLYIIWGNIIIIYLSIYNYTASLCVSVWPSVPPCLSGPIQIQCHISRQGHITIGSSLITHCVPHSCTNM